jgi:putative tricarboxylic transport membrane protein
MSLATRNARIVFSMAVLLAGLLYTVLAFTDLNFLSRTGRPGPGFFPRIIGLMLVATSLLNIARDRQAPADEPEHSPFLLTLVGMALLSFLFVLSLNLLGGWLAATIFMLAALFFLNPEGYVTNILVSLAIPTALILLFDVWLNAAMPRGLIPFFG